MRKNYFFVILVLFVASAFALPVTSIYDIQYTTVAGPDTTYPSTFKDQVVTTEGIVIATEIMGDNFVISMPEGGAWKSLYVFDRDILPSLGDKLELTGTLVEFHGLTELKTVTNHRVISSGNAIPDPVVITTADLPFDKAGAEFSEKYESCFVKMSNVTVVDTFSHGTFGIAQTTARAMAKVDDICFKWRNATPPIVINMNERWSSVQGIVFFHFSEYKLSPRVAADLSRTVAKEDKVINAVAKLGDNYPNPFNPTTTVNFSLSEASNVKIDIYNLLGEKVTTLVNKRFDIGENHTATWHGKDSKGNDVASGVYFYKMTAGKISETKKMLLLK